MTTTVVITAHPAPPACSVIVHRTDADGQIVSHVLEHGATFNTAVYDGQTLTIQETPVRMIRKAEEV